MLEKSHPDKGCINYPVFHKLYNPQYYVSDFIDVWKIWWRPLKKRSVQNQLASQVIIAGVLGNTFYFPILTFRTLYGPLHHYIAIIGIVEIVEKF